MEVDDVKHLRLAVALRAAKRIFPRAAFDSVQSQLIIEDEFKSWVPTGSKEIDVAQVFVVFAGELSRMSVQGVYSTLEIAKNGNKMPLHGRWIAANGCYRNNLKDDDFRFIVPYSLDRAKFGLSTKPVVVTPEKPDA